MLRIMFIQILLYIRALSTVISHYQEIRINRKFMEIIATLGVCIIQKCIVRIYGFQQKARPKMRITNKSQHTWRKISVPKKCFDRGQKM